MILSLIASMDLSRLNPEYFNAEYLIWNISSDGRSLDEMLQASYDMDYAYQRAVAAQWDVGL